MQPVRLHAILSASTSSRWLVCTPSAILEAKFEDQPSEYADEGTLAHRLAEVELRHKLKRIEAIEYAEELEDIYSHPAFNESMQDYVNDYVTFVLESYAESGKGAQIFLESRLDLSEYVPEGFGTTDVNIINDEILDVIDLKYGKGVSVSAEDNKQMMLYGLGSLREFELSYSVKEVRMTIYQPRIDNYSSFTMSADALRKWGDEVLRPKATIAFKGEGEFVPGDHCRFCKVKPNCKANAKYQLDMAKYEFADPMLLTPDEISDILKRSDNFINWINSVNQFALDKAVHEGVKWPGFKVVEGRSNRKYSDELKVGTLLLTRGFTEGVIFNKKLVGITEMQKRIGKESFEKLVNPLLIKPPGSPTLTVDEDKRPEYNSAKQDFS